MASSAADQGPLRCPCMLIEFIGLLESEFRWSFEDISLCCSRERIIARVEDGREEEATRTEQECYAGEAIKVAHVASKLLSNPDL